MPDFSRLSIWETDPNQLSWYDHVIGRTQPPSYRQISYDQSLRSGFSYGLSTGTEFLVDEDSSWYYELKKFDEASERQRNAEQRVQATAVHAAVVGSSSSQSNLPIDPYFEYMFANAGMDDNIPPTPVDDEGSCNKQSQTWSQIDPENASYRINSTSLVPPNVSGKHPSKDIESHWQAFWQEKYETTLPMILAGPEQSLEEQRLVESYPQAPPSSFADESQIYRSESPDLIPAVYGEEDTSAPSFTESECSHDSRDGDVGDGEYNSYLFQSELDASLQLSIHKTILKPVSPRYTFAKKLLGSLSQKPGEAIPKRDAADLRFQNLRNVAGKRQLQEAGLNDEQTFRDEDSYRASKKLRFSEGNSLSHRHESCLDDHTSLRSTSKDFFKHRPLPSPPKGFVGQFDGMIIDQHMQAVFPYQPHQPVPRVPYFETFGAKAHPNGTFTHTHFRLDPFASMPDYNKYNITQSHPLTTCMSFATDMTISSCHPNIVALRSKEEEFLRREAHIECASARLEGISIGLWRYLQGSYGLEEYRQANMCICWDSCECNKMCTRYADLKCPCSTDIVVHGDD